MADNQHQTLDRRRFNDSASQNPRIVEHFIHEEEVMDEHIPGNSPSRTENSQAPAPSFMGTIISRLPWNRYNNGFTNSHNTRSRSRSPTGQDEISRLSRRNRSLFRTNQRLTHARDTLAEKNEVLIQYIADQEEKLDQLQSQFEARQTGLHTLESKYQNLLKNFNSEVQNHKGTREHLESIQKDKLSTIDRFEPVVDEELVSKFYEVSEGVKILAMFLARTTPTNLFGVEWFEIMSKDSKLCFDAALGSIDVTQKRARRMLWTNFFWKNLISRLFKNILQAFQGPIVDAVETLWENMFLDGKFVSSCEHPVVCHFSKYCTDQEGAMRWRVSTVLEMIKRKPDSHDETVVNNLVAVFEKLVEPHRFIWPAEQNETLHRHLKTMITRAVAYAQLLCTQRTRFVVGFPRASRPSNIKKLEDILRTNVDNEFDDLEREIEAPIWYNVKPALIKCGTGMGQSFDTEQRVLVKAFVLLKTE
jgi:molecular chaperone GrpE (heat shock protein)